MAQSDEPRRGTVLSGKYELRSVLGKGGMGVVFRGKHLGTDRPIAVKVLRRELMSDPTLAKRFVREAKAAAVMQHPNVVDVLDYGVEPDGTAFQVLELLEGESLGEHLARKGSIPIDLTLSLLLPVIHALAVAHGRGVIHRDLKPDNVFLARNAHGRIVPKLLDFGIAKLMSTDGTSSTLSTRSGSAIGTPAYMSPEQARGTGDVGTATDIWAIGVILFECVSGEVPFDAETGSILMARIIMEQARSLASVAPGTPAPIVAVIDRALVSQQEGRWPTMAAFAAALRDAATESGIALPPVGASDTDSMSLPPPRIEPDEELEAEPLRLDGDEDPRHPSTRAARTPTADTRARTVERSPAPDSEIEASQRTRAPRVPFVPVLAFSVVAVALVLLGMWMAAPPAAPVPTASIETAEPPPLAEPPQLAETPSTPVTPPPPPVAPPPVAPTVEVTPVAPEAAVVDGVPEPRERPHRTAPVREPRAETSPRAEPPATPRGSQLPDLTEW